MQVSYFLLIPTGESRGLLFSQIIVICKQFNNKKIYMNVDGVILPNYCLLFQTLWM